MIPSLVFLVDEALAAREVLLAAVQSQGVRPKGCRGPGKRTVSSDTGCAPTGGSAGEEVFLFESVSSNPFPRLTRLPKYLFLGPKAGYDPS